MVDPDTVDLAGSQLSVEQQPVPARGGAALRPAKSRRSHGTIALDSETVAVLAAHRDAQVLERDFAADAYEDWTWSLRDLHAPTPVLGRGSGRAGRGVARLSPTRDGSAPGTDPPPGPQSFSLTVISSMSALPN